MCGLGVQVETWSPPRRVQVDEVKTDKVLCRWVAHGTGVREVDPSRGRHSREKCLLYGTR